MIAVRTEAQIGEVTSSLKMTLGTRRKFCTSADCVVIRHIGQIIVRRYNYSMDIDERMEVATANHVCFRCLKKVGRDHNLANRPYGKSCALSQRVPHNVPPSTILRHTKSKVRALA